MRTPDKKHTWLTFSDKLPQNQPSWTFSPNSYNRTYGRRMYRPPKKRRSWSHKSQIFLKSHDFWQIFLWFLTFSPKWITFDTCSPWLTPKNKGGLLWLTFDKNQSKKFFFKKNCRKNLYCPFSADLFSWTKSVSNGSVKTNWGTNELQMIGHYENE